MAIGIIITVLAILSIPTVIVVFMLLLSCIPFVNKNEIIEDKTYRKAVRDKYWEVEKYFRDKLASLPKYKDIGRYVKISSNEFGSVVRNSRNKHSEAIYIHPGFFGGIFVIVDGNKYDLNDKEKEWVVLNYETMKKKFDKEFDEISNTIASEMEEDENKMFKVMSTKIPSLTDNMYNK